ncbi:MAG: ABC transporter permease [Proteobacteria bacterium]|nr:MAG: ABC transporter permease [Pseudomonadota bacterium]
MPMLLEIAFRNLLQARRRTLLLGLAIAIVASLFLILRAVSSSVSERMIESATTLSSGHVNVGGFFKTRRKDAAPLLNDGPAIKEAVKAIIPDYESMIDRHRGWGRVISPAASINVGMNGITFEQEGRFFKSLRLAHEDEYVVGGTKEVHGSFDDMKGKDTVLIFAAQAKKLEVKVGDTLTVVTEAAGQSNTADLKIAAIASDVGFMSNYNIYVPRQTILDLYRLNDKSTGVVMLYLKNPEESLAVMDKLRKGLTEKGFLLRDHEPNPFFFKFEKVMGEDWLGQKLDLTIWSDEISFVLWVTSALDLVSIFVISVLGVIIIGGIMNSMWMSVRERIKEIGTMRAIGASKRYIGSIFVLEAVLLGLFSSAAGVLLGCILVLSMNAFNIPITNDGVRLFLMSSVLNVNLHAKDIISTLILFSALTGFAALFPALKAAKLRPVEALMHSK